MSDVFPHGCGDIHHPFVLRPIDLDKRGGLTLVPDNQVGVPKPITHCGDITQAHDGAVTAAEYDNLLKILLVVALAEDTHTHFGFPGINTASRQIKGAVANRICNIFQREP